MSGGGGVTMGWDGTGEGHGWWRRVAPELSVCRTTATSSWDPSTPRSTAVNIQSNDNNSSSSNDNNFTYGCNCCVHNGRGGVLAGGRADLGFQHKKLWLNGKLEKGRKE